MKSEYIKILESGIVNEFENYDPSLFSLRYYNKFGHLTSFIAEQIKYRNKAKVKFPSFQNKSIAFSRIPFEQSSGELAAKNKLNILSGNRLIDLTGGFGIDAFFFSEVFDELYYCEMDSEIHNLFDYNKYVLKKGNILTYLGNSIELLKNFSYNSFSAIYIDPSRRKSDRRIFNLESQSPNINEVLPMLIDYSDNVLVKFSPAYNYLELIKSFDNIKSIHLVSIENDAKELLILFKKNYNDNILLQSDFFVGNKKVETSTEFAERTPIKREIYSGEKYLYLSDVSINLLELNKFIIEKFNIKSINQNGTVMISNNIIDNYPGRIFRINEIFSGGKKSIIKKILSKKYSSLNLILKSTDINSDLLYKELKVSQGSETFLILTSTAKNEYIAFESEHM